MEAYDEMVERSMRFLFESLSEKDRRRYAAVEAIKLGHGGIEYVARVMRCDPKTIRQGQAELEQLPTDPIGDRVRKRGGRRATVAESTVPVAVVDGCGSGCGVDPLDAAFLKIVTDQTAGNPMKPGVLWTNLSARQIVKKLKEAGFDVGRRAVRRLLAKHRLGRRKAAKVLVMGGGLNRDQQFCNIARLKKEYLDAGDPVISIDTKKREMVGNFFRPGSAYTTQTVEVYDHDFPSFADGVVIPHGVYDISRNVGHITLGTSHDTSEFACDSIRLWWERQGKAAYPNAKNLLVLCDGGGSNSASRYLFKEQLQQLADELGVEIRVAHYPPYCSKYNPIEHRLFPHVTRACQGVIFKNMEVVKAAVQKTATAAGLSVTVDVLDRLYQIGMKVAAGFKKTMRILFDEFLPKWNYRAVPAAH